MPDDAAPDFELILGDCKLRVFPALEYCETVFRDGSKTPASPEDTEEYRQRARDLGYGEDTWAMCLEHELFHTVLGLSKGQGISYVLWDVAHGFMHDSHWAEEAAVLEMQRNLRRAVSAGRACSNPVESSVPA